MTRKWFLCKASLPSKIFRVCLPGPETSGYGSMEWSTGWRQDRGWGEGWEWGQGVQGTGWGYRAGRRATAKRHLLDSGASTSLLRPARVLPSTSSSPSPVGGTQLTSHWGPTPGPHARPQRSLPLTCLWG